MSVRARAKAGAPVPEQHYTIEDLRPFLTQPEQERIKNLEHKLETPEVLAEAVGKILPQAAHVSQQQGEELASAMRPLIISTVHESVRQNPETFAEAIFPSIGPAIRKAVGAALESLVQRIDELVQRTMTVESLKWRIEALRTGRAFAELVMLNNLAYRVEHVFLVHREGAIVLQHVAAKDVTARDPDQVTAMLAAIDDFAREAFREPEGGLSRFRMGELTGIVQRGPRAFLIAIVRGVATKEVETSLAATLERIHGKYAELLAQFKGQVSAFESTRDALVRLLREEQKAQKPKNRRRAKLVIASFFAVALISAVIVWIIVHQQNKRFADYVDAVGKLPGVTVTMTGQHADRRFVEGLHDPLAQDPASLLAAHGLLASDVELRFKPMYSLDPSLTERRAAQILRPPVGVSLRVDGDWLIAQGNADRAWINRARILATTLPGIVALDDTRLYEMEAINSAYAAATSLENIEIPFLPNSIIIPSTHRVHIDSAARAMQDLLASAPPGGLVAQIEIIGHTNATEQSEKNQQLSEQRAATIAAELRKRGVVASNISVRGVGFAEDPSRKVNFVVQLVPRAGKKS
jgi:hypothetical protein